MSETYTVGGDTLYKIDDPNFLGQTFRPIESHTLEYIDLEMRGPLVIPMPQIRVFFAGVDHKPVGDDISVSRYISEKKSGLFTTARARFSMSPVDLLADDYYVMTMRNDIPFGGNSAWCQYDADGATYPRGVRISSPDNGATWIVHPDSDVIFAEFGSPPLPKPEPPPPIDNFAPIDLVLRHFTNATLIRLSTSVPCHLSLYWTDKQPRKHHTSRVVRGLEVPWGTYFCFVAWQTVEQEEPGDSLYHTFIVKPWHLAQVRWFTVRGEVDFNISPSVGPIFKHIHPGQDIIKNPTYVDWPAGQAIPTHWEKTSAVHTEADPVRDYDYWIKDGLSPRLSITFYPQVVGLRQYLDVTGLQGRTVRIEVYCRGLDSYLNGFGMAIWGDTFQYLFETLTTYYQWQLLSETTTLPDSLWHMMVENLVRWPWPFVPTQGWVDDWQIYLE